MKRLLPILFIGAAMLPASATVTISWFNANDVLVQAGPSQISAPAGWLVQLIWSPDNTASAVNPASPTAPTGGESVLFSQGLNAAGSFDGNGGNPINVADGLAGGYVYTRVFNVPFGSSNTPTMWGTSSNVGNDNPTAGSPLMLTTVDPSTVNNHNALNILVVPEPGTLAFAGVGALAFGLRRLRRRA